MPPSEEELPRGNLAVGTQGVRWLQGGSGGGILLLEVKQDFLGKILTQKIFFLKKNYGCCGILERLDKRAELGLGGCSSVTVYVRI